MGVKEKRGLGGGFWKVKRVGGVLREVSGLEEVSEEKLFFEFRVKRWMS